MPQAPNKKLIEVALPLEAINAQSSREKSIRHGHPSTLHLYWARRPLATARAVIWASLVDDPSSRPDLFPTEEAQEEERKRLFKILEELVKWENSNNQKVLEEAKAEIKRSMGNDLPPLLDPFAGGGAIPLEAQRLGLEAHAHDLNPVAVIINKAMIELPARFAGMPPVNPKAQALKGMEGKGAAGLAEDVRYYGEWIKNEAFKQIGSLYPKVKDKSGIKRTVIAWIWARTVKCPNPACGIEAPLAHSFVLSKKEKHEAYIKPFVEGGKVRYEVHEGNDAPESIKTARGQFRCVACGAVMDASYIKKESCAGRLGAQMMGIAAEGDNGRIYFSPNEEHIKTALCESPEDAPESSLPEKALGFRVQRYGLTRHKDLFTSRQLTLLTSLSNLIEEAQKKAEEDALRQGLSDDGIPLREGGRGAKAYGEAVAVYLALLIDKMSNFNSSFCAWVPNGEKIANIFGRQALPMVWDYAESNPFCSSSGSFDNMLGWVVECIEELPTSGAGHATQADAQADCGLRGLMVSTDPPYYDNIAYAELSDFFYIWLRRSLKSIYPDLFRTMLAPKEGELIANPFRFDGSGEQAEEYFENGMHEALKRIYDAARADIPVTIYYAFKQSAGWETMLSSIIKSGFAITGTWPMRTERSGRLREHDSNALASSIVHVCRKRKADAGSLTSKEFESALERELAPALKYLEEGGIAPVDIDQAAIGPGIAVFSRYNKVLESDGSKMTVRGALQRISEAAERYFSVDDSSLDGDSRFCRRLFYLYGFSSCDYADVPGSANIKDATVERLREQKVLYNEKGKVRLFRPEELPKPESVSIKDCSAWMLLHLLVKALDSKSGGREACAAIYNRAAGAALQKVQGLARRLYLDCDRKKLTADARGYNNLVSEWQNIEKEAAKQKDGGAGRQRDLF